MWSPVQFVLFVFQAFYYDLDKVRIVSIAKMEKVMMLTVLLKDLSLGNTEKTNQVCSLFTYLPTSKANSFCGEIH